MFNFKFLFMRKFLFILSVCILSLSSCSNKITTSTATTKAITPHVYANTFADLEIVSGKLSYVYVPTNDVIAGGKENIIKTAEALLLKQYDADVLVEPQYIYEYKDTRTISKVTVTGYAAKYKNFRSATNEEIINLSTNFKH